MTIHTFPKSHMESTMDFSIPSGRSRPFTNSTVMEWDQGVVLPLRDIYIGQNQCIIEVIR